MGTCRAGEAIHAYVSVFAPVDLQTTVRHQSQYYEKNGDTWVTTDDLAYDILGGCRGEYRARRLRKTFDRVPGGLTS